MHVLVVSQYFRPEPGATQNRLGAFVDGLVANGHRVTVLCEQPNHPAGVFHPGYGRRPVAREREGGATVFRLWVATSPEKSSIDRIAFYGTFALGAAMLSAALRYDVMLASSPPLPGAAMACRASASRKRPFVLDVRDPWPAAAVALGELSPGRALDGAEAVERWLYRRASGLTATTQSFCRHIDSIVGEAVSVHLPNGALDSLVEREPAALRSSGTFVVGYTGNFGIAQGLDIVSDAAERLRGADVRFLLVGDGPLAAALQVQARTRHLSNVVFRPAVPVEQIGAVLDECDALLVPLGAEPLLANFIPSKLYDAMAAGRPVLLAASGESAAVVQEAGCGLVVPPRAGAALSSAITRLAEDRALGQAFGARGREAARALARSVQRKTLERVLQDALRRHAERPAGTHSATAG